jgi:Abortive infection C-terminus
MTGSQQLLEKVKSLENLLVSFATGGGGELHDYLSLRNDLINEPLVAEKLPGFIRTCRDLSQFWAFIKKQSATYQGRREFLWTQFGLVADFLERGGSSPADVQAEKFLTEITSPSVHEAWKKAFERREKDPEGAITSGRSLLEAVCKFVLDKSGATYDEGIELPKLYKAAAEKLNLAPSQHTEQIFKQILGGCQSVVEGLGALRNKLGDAHGGGQSRIKPSKRHAELAVNLAGTMASFLVSTWEEQQKKKS